MVEQIFQHFLRHAERGAEVGGFLHQRKIFGCQSLQGKFTFSAFEDDFVLARFQRHGLVGGNGAQNINQFACAHGGAEILGIAVKLRGGADLNFQIAGRELQRRARFAQQHICQNGQSMPTFHNAGNRLQDGQNFFLC